jgi:hypothetical protein
MAKRPAKPTKPAKRAATPKAPAKMGRPSTFTLEMAETICSRMSEGETLSDICRTEGFPDRVTVFRWEKAHEDFRNALARAREAQAHRWAEELLAIADDGQNDFMERKRADGSIEVAFNAEHVQRSRLRVDTRKWLLTKALPRLYGDRVEGDLGTASNPIVLLLQQVQARALPVVPTAPTVEGTATEVGDD